MAILPLSAIFPLKACTMANSLILDLQWDVRAQCDADGACPR